MAVPEPDYAEIGRTVWNYYRKRASTLAMRAVKDGRLPRADSQQCADCGGAAAVYDHRNYCKPLDVSPVCDSCNYRRGPAELSPVVIVEHIRDSGYFPFESAKQAEIFQDCLLTIK